MRNNALLNHPVNKTFEEVLWMTEQEFRDWCIELRKVVVDLWDNHELPPRVGFTEKETIDQFKSMLGFPVHEFELTDLLTGENDVIRNTSVIGNAVNDWFPTMMKTRITYTTVDKAKSIYDFFAKDELLETFITYASRHFKRDSFYHYSTPISAGDKIQIGPHTHIVTSFGEFNDWFENNIEGKYDWDWWFCGVKSDKEYTGYNQELKKKQNLILNVKDIIDPYFIESWDPHVLSNVDEKRWDHYTIRLYQYGQKLFPIGLKAFRVSFCQYAVNFPPLTAKYIYENYLPEHNDEYVIYDPSMGWGGRLLGALSVDNRRKITYIGTDPNSDHVDEHGVSKYQKITDFFNKNVRQQTLFPDEQKTLFFHVGSEEIHKEEKFKEYKGKVDLIFTSPPYFAKEVYSEDEAQSCHRYGSSYVAWKEGFLKPTLETCVEWLKPNRYLLWNIADAQFNNVLLPLEQDSIDILTSLGMRYDGKLKMSLSPMPGANRFEELEEYEEIYTETLFGNEIEKKFNIKGKMKNFCKIKSSTGKELLLKYEPILVFFKE